MSSTRTFALFEAIDVVPLCLSFCTNGGEEKGAYSCPFSQNEFRLSGATRQGLIKRSAQMINAAFVTDFVLTTSPVTNGIRFDG